MNFDTPVKFFEVKTKYNPATSKYEPLGDPKLLYTDLASVTDIGVEVSLEEYGSLDIKRISIRLMNPLPIKSFTHILVGNERFIMDGSISPRGTYLRGVHDGWEV